MRIHHLRLENYRGVGLVTINFPTEGVTIIEGDNEVGKSSIPEAIDLLLTQRDDSNAKSVKAVKPVNQDVGAEVEIELSSGTYRFRYRKRWHRQKETVLEIFEPSGSHFTGREAHEKVVAILDETLDRGLWDALQLRQGAPLAQASFAGGSLGRALDLAAGGDARSGGEDDLWARITIERERYWTANGQAKVDRKAAAAAVAVGAARVEEIEALLRGLEADAAMVGRLGQEDLVLVEKQVANDDELAGLRVRSDAINAHQNAVNRLTAQRDTAQADHTRVLGVSERRAEQVQRFVDASREVDTIKARIAAAVPARALAEGHQADLQQKVSAGSAALAAAAAARALATADCDYRRWQIETEQLSERHQRVVAALERQVAATAVVDHSLVDDEVAQRVEDAHLELVKAEASATSAAATVDAHALAAVQIEINGQAVALAAGDHHEIVVVGSAEVVLPGAISMVIKAGAEAQAVAERRRRAEADFAAACAQGGVAGVAEARQAALARTEASRVVIEAQKSIAQDLRDLTAEALAQKLERLTERVTAYAKDRAADPPLPADLNAAQALAADGERAWQEAHNHVTRLTTDLEAAAQALGVVDQADAVDGALLAQAEGVSSADSVALEAARQEQSDDDVAGSLEAAAVALRDCVHELTTAEALLAAADPLAVADLRANAEAVKTRLADDRHGNEGRIRDLRARLEVRGEEGLATKLDSEKSALVQRRVEHERLEGRAEAAKMLYDAFAARRAEAQHRYVAPFRERIVELGRLVFGPTLDIELGDDLGITRRTLNGISLDFDHLSSGAQEQLGMISRLACAAIVASDGGVPVIFDDALGWSDPGRLHTMATAIALAGRHCQILVLTCTPQRYTNVGHATVIQLPTGSAASPGPHR